MEGAIMTETTWWVLKRGQQYVMGVETNPNSQMKGCLMMSPDFWEAAVWKSRADARGARRDYIRKHLRKGVKPIKIVVREYDD